MATRSVRLAGWAGHARGLAWRVRRSREHRRIIGAALLVGVMTFGVKIAAMARDVYVAAELGTGDALEAYIAAMVIPGFMATITGNAAVAALMPQLAEARAKRGEAAARAVFAEMILVATVLTGAAAIVLALTPGLLLPIVASGFSGDKLDLATRCWLLMIPSFVIGGVATLWSGMLNADNRFGLAAVAPVMIPVSGGLALFLVPRGEAVSLSIGFVAGTLLEAALIAWGLRRQGLPLRAEWHGLLPETRAALRQYLPLMVNNTVFNAVPVVDQAMAATLGARNLSVLNYGNKLVQPMLSIGSVALLTAVFPYLSRLVAVDDWRGVRRAMGVYTGLILAASIPAVGFVVIASETIVRLLFQRGAFSAADTSAVAGVQATLMLMVPFATLAAFYSRILISMRASHVMLIGSCAVFVLNIVCDYLFKEWFGIAGIALASVVNYAVQMTFCLSAIHWLWRRRGIAARRA